MPSVEHHDPLYGTVEFSGPPAEVIRHPAVQRLKRVHQNGAAFLINPDMDTSRFEHTLGVAALCQRLGATDREIVAALLHDVGHTAFSHVADHVLNRRDQAFHEDEVHRIVERYALDDALDRLGYDAAAILDPDRFPILEQDLPDICADRIDYQLRDLYKYGLVDRATVTDILEGLELADGCPVASDAETARALVDVSLVLQRQVFFDEHHEAATLVLADVIRTGLERGVLTVDDLFRTDADVLQTLRGDPELDEVLTGLERDVAVERSPSDPTHTITRKLRTTDPCVAGTGTRISELDPAVERKRSLFERHTPLEQTYAIRPAIST